MAHELVKSYVTDKYRMAYRKRSELDRPWHDDSTNCTAWAENPTIDQVIQDLEANIDLMLRPLFDKDGQEVKEVREVWRPHTSDLSFVDQDGAKGRRVGVVGPQFTLIQDHEVVEWFEPWVDSGSVTIETGGAILGGSRFWVLGKLSTESLDVVNGDCVHQHILAVNGHDGKLSFCALPTTVRVVCNNTLNVAMASKVTRKYKAKHNRLVSAKLTDIRTEIEIMQAGLSDLVDKYRFLAQHNVKSSEQLEIYLRQVLKIEDEKKTKPLESIIQLFEDSEYQKLPGVSGTWWAAFNAVTEFTTHMRGRNSDTRLDNMVSGLSLDMTNRAFDLGLVAATV